ncbi:MAG: ATP-binding protein [Bdellovibrionales bacterium]
MKSKTKRPKISLLHDEIPPHVQEFMHLTRLAEMGRLAANVAHEINNPLMVAQGFAENIELLLDDPNLQRDEMRLQVLEIIKACQRMSRIVNKMNRMSRSQKLRLFIVDLTEVALNAVDFIKSQISANDVTVEFDFDHPLPIKCDAIQVEQIILNILSNAIFAMESVSGDKKVRISFEEFGKWQQIKVWNNGPAIPVNVQAQIMSPFFTTKEEGEGTGLGLAVSKAIMEVHGGDLSFKSDASGTEFCLAFPRPIENPWQQRERQDKGLIVIIDRQANYRRTLHEKFRLLGFRVEAFADYVEGMATLKVEQNIAGVLVDIVPGQRESMSFIHKLRAHLGPTGLIFTVSNFPSARDLRKDLKAAGATECFEKPIHADNFAFILKLLDSTVPTEVPADAADKVAA